MLRNVNKSTNFLSAIQYYTYTYYDGVKTDWEVGTIIIWQCPQFGKINTQP